MIKPAVMRRLMKEITELKTSPPEGIRVQTAEDNMLDLTGIIEGPGASPCPNALGEPPKSDTRFQRARLMLADTFA
jgi:ubiquitin-protein ligase